MGVVGHLRVDPLVDALHEPVRHHALLRPAAARRPRAPEPAALRPEHNIYLDTPHKNICPPAAEVSGGAVGQAALVLGVTLVLTAAPSLEVLLLMPSI